MRLLKIFWAIVIGCFVCMGAYALDITSDAFTNGGYLPDRYTCDVINISQPLTFAELPKNTKSLALIGDDPDAPFGTWVHWVVYNIPVTCLKLEEGALHQKTPDKAIVQGINDFGEIGYGGACPPPGKDHRYFFKLYALDTVLDLKEGAARKELDKAITGHILAETKIYGRYQRK